MANFLTIKRISQLLQSNALHPAEVLKSSLCRAVEIQHLNAFVSLNRHATDVKQKKAKMMNQSLLATVPFALKDNYSSKDLSTSCASVMLKGYQPPYNCTVLDKLLQKGAFHLGQTNMDEFAMGSGSVDSIYQAVKNPWTPGILSLDDTPSDWNIAGGSSGGSAVAVATGSCTFAFGSDTGGSVRNPAAYCGVVGLKPTYGTISRHGLVPLVNTMDCPSIITRTVADAAIVFDAVSGSDEMDSTSVGKDPSPLLSLHTESLQGYRVGIPKECLVSDMSMDVINAWKWAADQFENAGAEVVEVSLPHMRYSIVCYHILCCCEVASNMARFDGLKYGYRSEVNESSDAMMAVSRKTGLSDTVRSRVLAGNYFLLKENREKYFQKAQRVRRLISEDYSKVFGANFSGKSVTRTKKSEPYCDILLYPPVLSDAPLYSEFMQEDNRTRSAQQDVLTQSANLAGVPAITVPIKLSAKALPIGMQITGPCFSEPVILKVASFLENISNFPSLENQFKKPIEQNCGKL